MPAARPDGPRTRLGADERRQQIIAATVRVIESRGYAAATLTEIASEARIAKGLVWHYFDDRDDLMRHAVDSLGERIRSAVVDGLDVTAPAPQVVRAVLHRTAALTRTHAAELEAVDQIVHNLRTPDGRQRMSMRDYEPVWSEHQRLLQRGQDEGSMRRTDTRTAALVYQGAIDAMIGYLQAHPDADPEKYADSVADVLLSGLVGSPQRTDQSGTPGQN